MKQRIFVLGTNEAVEISSRADLANPNVQATLKSFHGRNDLCCGCVEDHGLLARLSIRRISNSQVTVVREDVREHLQACCLNRDGDDASDTILRREGIFAPPSATDGERNMSPSTLEKWNRRRYDTFTRYARRVFSRGLAKSFVDTWRKQGQPANPGVASVMRGIEAAIREIFFEGDVSGHAIAERHGCRLRFGFIYDLVTERRQPIGVFNAYWWDGQGFVTSVVAAHPLAIAPAVADLVILGNIQAPPYFVMAVQDKEGGLARVFLHQVMADGHVVIPLESTTEGAEVAARIEAGAILLKPVKIIDTQWVLGELGLGDPSAGEWDYCPDFVELHGEHFHIREVRGFKRGTKHGYDERLVRKADYYRSLSPDRPDFYGEIDGTKLRHQPQSGRPETWADSTIRFEPLPPGLFMADEKTGRSS